MINRKSLRQKQSRPRKQAVSFLSPGRCSFKVGYTGRIKDIYNANPNNHLNKILEEKQKRSNSLRKRQRREASYLQKYGAKIQKSQEMPLPEKQIREVAREIDSQMIKSGVGRTVKSIDGHSDNFQNSSKEQTTFDNYVAEKVEKKSEPLVPENEVDHIK